MRAKVRGTERARERQAADLERRAAMFWMLHEAGASYGAIARGAGLSPGRVRQVCQDYAYQLHRRSEYVTGREPFSVARERSWGLPSATGGGSSSRASLQASHPLRHRGRSRHPPLGQVRDPGARARPPRSGNLVGSTRRSAP